MTSTIPISRECALKVALAARVMSGINVGQLLEVLHNRIEGDLTESSLKLVTVTDLKTSFSSLDGEEDGEDIGIGLEEMKEAVRILWGEESAEQLPPLQHFPESASPSVRVAIASNSGEQLNGHFGSCIRYLIYQVSVDNIALVDIRSALEADFSDDRNLFRANLIQDCDVIYVVSVGGPAAAKIIRAGVHPIKELNGGEARTVLSKLQTIMGKNPPPWLAKILGQSPLDRIRCQALMEEEAE
ncbi:MAG: dinitrogenase iron-molybdenum cofactor biosynthesis protein [Pseudomonadales bacterium]|nr:dinitrogenase iron-molybdenum cofactor biosynthesis protein [Pseudomonadales bacterium]